MPAGSKKTDLLVIVIGFTIIGLLVHNQVIIWSVITIAILSLSFKWFEDAVLWIWNKIAHVMGWVMSKLLLGIAFYLFLVPLSFLKKISGSRDSLQLKNNKGTTWVERNHTFSREDIIDSF